MEINMTSKVAMAGARSRLVVLLHSFFALPILGNPGVTHSVPTA